MKTTLAPILISLTLVTLTACTTSSDSIFASKAQYNEGKALFEDNCQRCHRYADDLKEPKSFLEKTIHSGGESMPSFQGVLTTEEEKTIAEYIVNI